MKIKEQLLKSRAFIKNIYAQADIYLVPALKFVLAFVVFSYITSTSGYLEILDSTFILVILSLVCAILPLNGMVIIGIALVVAHSFGISMEVGFIALFLYVILLILFLRFVPEDSIGLIIMPLAFNFNMAAVVPLTLGMTRRASSVLTSVCAVLSYHYIRLMPTLDQLAADEELSSLEKLKEMLEALVGDTVVILYLIVFVTVTLVVYLLRKILTYYGFLISIIAGAVSYIVLMIIGSDSLQLDEGMSDIFVEALISAVIALVIAFFIISVNYKESKYLQFEDDDYYYYVKAIPKNKVITSDEDDNDEEEVDHAGFYFDNEVRWEIKQEKIKQEKSEGQSEGGE